MGDTENRTERFEMRMTARDLASLDRLRKVEQDLPTRAEMVRRLIERASPLSGHLQHYRDAIREAEDAARLQAFEEAAKMVRENDFNLVDPEALASAIRQHAKGDGK